LFVVLVVLGGAVSAWQAVRATQAERQALADRDQAQKEKDRAEARFRMARDAGDRFFTQVGESPLLKARALEQFRKDLRQNAKESYERFIRKQLAAPAVRQDLGQAHSRLARIHLVVGDYPAAEDSAKKAIDILSELERAHPDVAEYRRDLAASHFGLG